MSRTHDRRIWLYILATGSAIFLTLPSASAEDNTLSIQYQDQSFDVKTSLTNGVVNTIELDPDFTSIILDVETGDEDGVLTITLPRTLIDARAGNSTTIDDKFIVVVGAAEVDYEESSSESERELTIAIPAGTERIEIVGTQVVPEFPVFMAGTLAAILLVTILAIQRKKIE